MKYKKATFITIIVLLVIFLPLTVIGFVTRKPQENLDDNPNHELYYNNAIWFYNETNNLIGKYSCKEENCTLAQSIIDDEAYGINYYKEGSLINVPLINNAYAFIKDGDNLQLYDIANERVIPTNYHNIKDYHTFIANNYYIVQAENDLWGVLGFPNMPSNPIPFEYNYIGLVNYNLENNNLDADKFIVMKDNLWYIIDSGNSALSGEINDPIIDYSDDFIISKNDEKIRVYAYNDRELLTEYEIKDYVKLNNYLGIITSDNLYIYLNINNPSVKTIPLNNIEGKITMERVDNKLNIKVDDNILDSVDLS